MTTGRRENPREFGRDGITVMVNADRALRVREIGRPTLPERNERNSLLNRIEGRSGLPLLPKATRLR